MSQNTMVILFMVGLFVLFFGIRFIATRLLDKSVDAVENAIAKKKNEKNAGKSENLADRFK